MRIEQKMILDKLNTFNRGKTSDKGRYYILLPTSKTLYYTLWFFTPSATYHPTVYLANLDLNAISSVNKAIKMVSNSFLPLFITTDIKDSPEMETILFLSVNTEDTICMTSIRSIPDTSFG